jgi:hypothetical protein
MDSEQAMLTTTDIDLFTADYVRQAKVADPGRPGADELTPPASGIVFNRSGNCAWGSLQGRLAGYPPGVGRRLGSWRPYLPQQGSVLTTDGKVSG